MRILLFIRLCVAILAAVAANKYDGSALFEATANTIQQASLLKSFLQRHKFEVLQDSRYPHQTTIVVVTPRFRRIAEEVLNEYDIKYNIIHEDFGLFLTEERNRWFKQRESVPLGQMAFNISDYNTYPDMIAQLEVFASDCPDGFTCGTEVIGKSRHERDLVVLKISSSTSGSKAVWVDSLIHANEWLGGTTNMNIINHLIYSYNSDSTVQRLMDTYNWYFLPVMNPDGYEIAWESADTRGWRKSNNTNVGSDCRGTDLNRNYNYKWLNAGASTDPCSNTYAGSSPASEPETQVIQNQSLAIGGELRAWISLHTSGRMWLHSYGSVDSDGVCERSEDHDDQYQTAYAAANATMATYRTPWTWGSICETIYPAAGGTIDFVYAQGGVKYAYTPELRTEFAPPTAIEPTWTETWNGIVALLDEAEAIESAGRQR